MIYGLQCIQHWPGQFPALNRPDVSSHSGIRTSGCLNIIQGAYLAGVDPRNFEGGGEGGGGGVLLRNIHSKI